MSSTTRNSASKKLLNILENSDPNSSKTREETSNPNGVESNAEVSTSLLQVPPIPVVDPELEKINQQTNLAKAQLALSKQNQKLKEEERLLSETKIREMELEKVIVEARAKEASSSLELEKFRSEQDLVEKTNSESNLNAREQMNVENNEPEQTKSREQLEGGLQTQPKTIFEPTAERRTTVNVKISYEGLLGSKPFRAVLSETGIRNLDDLRELFSDTRLLPMNLAQNGGYAFTEWRNRLVRISERFKYMVETYENSEAFEQVIMISRWLDMATEETRADIETAGVLQFILAWGQTDTTCARIFGSKETERLATTLRIAARNSKMMFDATAMVLKKWRTRTELKSKTSYSNDTNYYKRNNNYERSNNDYRGKSHYKDQRQEGGRSSSGYKGKNYDPNYSGNRNNKPYDRNQGGHSTLPMKRFD